MTPEKFVEHLERVAERFGWKLNRDMELVVEFAKGLLKNKERYGFAYCPCRFPIGDEEVDRRIICPCVYARESDVEEFGRCYCGLFVSKEVYDGLKEYPDVVPDRHMEFILKRKS